MSTNVILEPFGPLAHFSLSSPLPNLHKKKKSRQIKSLPLGLSGARISPTLPRVHAKFLEDMGQVRLFKSPVGVGDAIQSCP